MCCCTEMLLDMMSLKSTKMQKDIFETVSDAVKKMGFKWGKHCGVIMDGVPTMAGDNDEHVWLNICL